MARSVLTPRACAGAAMVVIGFAAASISPAAAQSATLFGTAVPDWLSLHAQDTEIEQYHPAFTSPVRGANSLDPGSRGDETSTATLYLGARLTDDSPS